MGKWVHRISDIDPAIQVATCAECGPGAPIVLHRTRGYWVCRVGRNSRNPRPYSTHKRAYYLKSRFGISESDYDALLDEQGGGCAICGNPPASVRRLAVDHDHTSGAVRGLLCGSCNTALGSFKEDPQLLASATTYLQRHK